MTTPIEPPTRALETVAARAGREPHGHGALCAPIAQSTTFSQAPFFASSGASPPEFTYSRAANPTVAALEEALGALEDAPPAVCQRSGMAAITTLLLATLECGDRVAIARSAYGGTVRLAREVLGPLGVDADFFAPSDPGAVTRVLGRGPALVLLESPGNPTLEVADIAALAARAHDECGALVAVDATFQTPCGLRPLDLGADVTVHSTSKFIEGHGTAIGGALLSRDRALLDRLRRITKSTGCAQAPLDAWLTLRGVKTLPLRFERQCRSAEEVARWIDACGSALDLRYPGLASFEGREIAERQHLRGQDGAPLHGAIVTFELGGGLGAARAFLGALELVVPAEHLGSAETLATHPATMTHGDVPPKLRAEAGVTDGLVRLSIGLEAPADIIADLEGAFAAARAARFRGVRSA